MLNKKRDWRSTLRQSMVPLLFIVIIALAIPLSGFSSAHLIGEILARFARDTFLAVSLIIPILAGMGINFAISLGAMAAQIGIIITQNFHIGGIGGMLLSALIGLPIAILLGWFAGSVMNKAKGREMISSMILAFLISGIYQFIVLYIMGGLIPIQNKDILLSRGYGIKNSITLEIKGALDNLWSIKFKIPGVMRPLSIPVVTFIVIALACVFVVWFKKTKIGHDMKAVGQSQRVADSAGMKVDKIRLQSIIISTVMAMLGQLIYLQNIGTMNTYNGTDQTSLFAAAALLIGGASVASATIPNALVGVVLFHLMFIVMPNAGKNLTGNPAIGEYFRSFISYGVVALALVMHAYSRKKAAEEERKALHHQKAKDKLENGEAKA
jgi:simple sugar transport system permease protein